MLKYCSKTIPDIVSKLNEMQLYIYKEYIPASEVMDKDAELASKVKTIIEKCIQWIKEMVELRNKALKEIDENISNVEKCNYVADIENFTKKIDKEIANTKEEVLKVINNQIAGVQNNGWKIRYEIYEYNRG